MSDETTLSWLHFGAGLSLGLLWSTDLYLTQAIVAVVVLALALARLGRRARQAWRARRAG